MTTPEALAPCPVCLGLERVSAGPVSMTVGGPEAPLKAVYNATVVAPVPAGPCERTLRVRLCLLTDAGAAGQCSSFQPIPGEMVEGSKLTFAAELPATANVALDLRCGREGGGETEVTVLMLPRWGIGAQR
jgi:hypothetical protein